MPEQRIVSDQRPPVVVRIAGALVAMEGLAGAAAAVIPVAGISTAEGPDPVSAGATLLVLLSLAAAVASFGVALYRGRWWPRTLTIIVQILLLAYAWMSFTQGAVVTGAVVGVTAATVLALTFSPPASRWMAKAFDLSTLPSEPPRRRGWFASSNAS
ncbi:hypothetical protein ACIP5Y_28455 [Nocardia sp. NPDC088792]|uniref:hypothetical protein n=1 Tax=Nocardia sp. NPDC088792 TaxID=3364332 RepID=UPI00380277E0